MELLDDDLRTILAHSVNNRLSVALQQHYALSMLACIESLHELGWIHNNISPEHFVRRNNGSAENELVLIDFSHATRFNSATPSYPTQTSAKCGKHCAYVSLNCHRGEKRSWSDDIWSWFFIVLEMNVGSLPWSNTDTWEESFAKKIEWEKGMKQLSETHTVSSISDSVTGPINPSSCDARTFSLHSSTPSSNNKNATVTATEPFCTPQHSTVMPQTPSFFVALFKLLSNLRFGEKADFNEIQQILHLLWDESDNGMKHPGSSTTTNRSSQNSSPMLSQSISATLEHNPSNSVSHHVILPVSKGTEWTELIRNGATDRSILQVISPSQSEISPHSLSTSFDYSTPYEIPSLLMSQTPFQNSNSSLFLTPSSSLKALGNATRKVLGRREEDAESTLWSHSFTLSSDDDGGPSTPLSQTSSLSQESPISHIPFSLSQLLSRTPVADRKNRQRDHVPRVTQVKELSAAEGKWVDEEQMQTEDTHHSASSLSIPLSELSIAFVKPEEPDQSILSPFSGVDETESSSTFQQEVRDLRRHLSLSIHSHHLHPHHITLVDRTPLRSSLLTTPHSHTFSPFFASPSSSPDRDSQFALLTPSEVYDVMNSHTTECLLFDVTRLSPPPTSETAEGRIGVGTHSSSVPNFFGVVSDILSPSSPFRAIPQPSDPHHVSPSLLSFPRFLVRFWALLLDSVRCNVLFTDIQRSLLIVLSHDRDLGLLNHSSFKVDFSLSRSQPFPHLSFSLSSSHHLSSSLSTSSLWSGKDEALGQEHLPPPPLGMSSELTQRDISFDVSPASSFCYLPSLSLADQLTSMTSQMGEESVELTGRQIGELLSQRRRKARRRRDQSTMTSSSLSHLSTKNRNIQSADSSQLLFDLSDSTPTLSIGDPFQPHLDMSVVFKSLAGDRSSTRRTQLLVDTDSSLVSDARHQPAMRRVYSSLRPSFSCEAPEIGVEEEGEVFGENESEEKRAVGDVITRSYSFPLLSPTQAAHLSQSEIIHPEAVRNSTTEHTSKETPKQSNEGEEEEDSDDDTSEDESILSAETEEECLFNPSPDPSFTPSFAAPTHPTRLDENGALQKKSLLSLSLLHSTFPLPPLSSTSLPESTFVQSSHSPSHLRRADLSLLHSAPSFTPQTESQKSVSLERVSLSDQLSGLDPERSPFSTRSATILPTLSSGLRSVRFGPTSKDDGT
ncbi:hypothetical protein BLNAU_21554 [Blattamonas nauphoetae]|uniref:Protein kinase domain-containing protein n=1 Tax=Blattamonas nauphoetae TaxID=2049346 RepID=A0ABQ9WVL6_9EUKA|nr:hypothetical protein BLNAU_21554 [Blattamonas nauphoetae]